MSNAFGGLVSRLWKALRGPGNINNTALVQRSLLQRPRQYLMRKMWPLPAPVRSTTALASRTGYGSSYDSVCQSVGR
jgi:hypothetical protein